MFLSLPIALGTPIPSMRNFFDAADAILDIPGVQQQRDSREAVDLFTVSTTIAPPSLETPITQA